MQSSTLTDPFENFITHQLSSHVLLVQLGPKYEEKRYILDGLPELARKILLDNALYSAINANHPVDTMNKKLTDIGNPNPVR